MNNLKGRITRLEDKLNANDDYSDWAMRAAQEKANAEARAYKDSCFFGKILREQCGQEVEDPKPPKLRTEEDISHYAEELSKKFSSYDDYKANIPPMDIKKLREVIAKLKNENKTET